MKRSPAGPAARGFTLVEVLVTMVVMLIGLLGIVRLQSRASATELESYERAQALSIARDMESRLKLSRNIVSGFLGDSVSSTDGAVYVGNGSTNHANADGLCPAPAAGSSAQVLAEHQACEWGVGLLGASMKETASGSRMGAMVGARGCVMRVEPAQANALADLYVVVVWQGAAKLRDPPAASPGAACASTVDFGDGYRRAVSLRVLVPNLTQ